MLFGQLQIYWCFAELNVSQYLRYWLFPLRSSFQLILHWQAPTQCIKVDNNTNDDGGRSSYPDSPKRKTGTKSIWLTSSKQCICAWHNIFSGMLLSHMQNFILQVNCMPKLQQVCSIISVLLTCFCLPLFERLQWKSIT